MRTLQKTMAVAAASAVVAAAVPASTAATPQEVWTDQDVDTPLDVTVDQQESDDASLAAVIEERDAALAALAAAIEERDSALAALAAAVEERDAALAALAAAAAEDANDIIPTEPSLDAAAIIISDSFGAHDAIPRGVPNGYSWRESADATPEGSTGWKNYGAVNMWGQIFPAVGASPDFNVRAQVRDPRLWWFDGSSWTEASNTPGSLGGAYFRGDYQQTATVASQARADGDGTYSVPLNVLASNNHVDNFHWWWNGHNPRIPVPADAAGLVSCADVRLVSDGGAVGDRSFIASVGVDLFATPTTIVGGPNGNPGIPQPRMKWVTGDWQSFCVTTMSSASIIANPPSL